jgi:hypothetical protein
MILELQENAFPWAHPWTVAFRNDPAARIFLIFISNYNLFCSGSEASLTNHYKIAAEKPSASDPSKNQTNVVTFTPPSRGVTQQFKYLFFFKMDIWVLRSFNVS